MLDNLKAQHLADAEENAAARKNAILLSVCQAINGSAAPLSVALGGIVGNHLLGSDKSLATLPVSGFTVGVALMSLPAALLMRRIGRRKGFMSGAIIGMAGMALAVYAIRETWFWLFVAALLLLGMANSFTQQYRFAAADRGTKDVRAKSIAWVMAGGVAAAIVGPQLILYGKDFMLPVPYAGAYLWGIALVASSIIVMMFLEPGHPPRSADELANKPQRPLPEIMRQPAFVVAVVCGTGTYAIMAFVMTAAPLAMMHDGFHVHHSTWGIQWHVLAMYAPSFFTGNLIARYGKCRIVAAGLLMLSACAMVGINGQSLSHYYTGLILLGLGWNFGFIGATAMVTDTYEPHEKNKVQGANDLILFSTVAISSLMSGVTLNALGWEAMNWLVFPIVGCCLLSLGWLSVQPRTSIGR